MISFLEGTIELTAEKFVVINTGGVGYKVFVGQETLRTIPEKFIKVNEAEEKKQAPKTKLWTHLHVREDALELYGFLHYAELDFFETLISISGIGPKGALGIMAVAPVDTLRKAIAAGDTSYLTRVSGVGRKTAEKIILELREKMSGKGVSVKAPELQEEADVLEALVSLGYSHREAREALSQVSQETKSVEKKVKEALKKLGKR